MSFLQLVRREMEGSLGRLVFVSAMGGLSTTAIIGAINAGAGAADKGEISLWAAGFFVIALLLFIQTQHFILITTTAEIGGIIHKLRVRLLDYVRRSELLPLESIGRAEIVSAITGDTAILSAMQKLAPELKSKGFTVELQSGPGAHDFTTFGNGFKVALPWAAARFYGS